MQVILQKLIQAYQIMISPWLGARCRFSPSCSEYAQQALKDHGVMRGLVLSFRRLSRCHPWGGSGHDPVPEIETSNCCATNSQQITSDQT